MLYVFHVDSGTMMRFDMNLALESVSALKDQIEVKSKIPADKQVLLISGGECLDPNKRVCSYSAGTDTNPIFLFSKSLIESTSPPAPTVDYVFDSDLERRIREHLDMPNSFNTVAKRAQLAQHLHDLAREQQSMCENLVHDQHLQQQGWSAVVANLEDISLEFRKRSEIFEKSFIDYMEERDSYLKFLSHFNKDLEILKRIPVLPVLLELEKQNLDAEVSKTSEENTNTSQDESESCKEITLYEWISAADSKSTMDQLHEHCSRGLEQFDSQVFTALQEDITGIMTAADNVSMKEIKGLGDRLYGLEKLMKEAKKIVKSQAEMAQSLVNNQNTASKAKDPSVLPDLCSSHQRALQMMAQNHQNLCDIRRRCIRAKDELNVNLYHRLRWVMFVEDHILETDQKLVIYHENLKRLRRHLEVLQQIHLAPATYLCAVAEVVRRRTFSQSFLLWASELACHLLTIHNEEVTRRKDFQGQFEGHFLNSLFPGMEDLPPPFATQAPSLFDSSLPQITEEDLDRLKKELPDLADNLNIPDSSAITNFFLIKSLVKKEDEKQDELNIAQEEIAGAVDQLELANTEANIIKTATTELCIPPPGVSHIKDLDKGCESETDTEEFEKVGQSPLELHFDKNAIPSPRARTHDVATSTEDNLQISRSEHEKLKFFLMKLQSLAQEAINQLRTELSELKIHVVSYKKVVTSDCESLSSSWENILVEKDNIEKELLDNLKKGHELVLSDMKREDESKIRAIETLVLEKSVLENDVAKLHESIKELKDTFEKTNEENSKKIEDLQNELVKKDMEKEKGIKEAADRLNREHKAEIENIRSRFKLMTMERSPSETNLEKSGDYNSLPSHTTLLVQMTENFEMDKEHAVAEARKNESEKWEKILAERIKELESTFGMEKDELILSVSKKVGEEKDKQIDILMEREKNLNLECLKHKSTIQQLAETNAESCDSGLLDKINILQKEKDNLEEELERLKAEKIIDMSTSVAVCEGKIDVMTSPIKQKDIMSKSEIGIGTVKTAKLTIESCKPGDWVFVVWDPTHESFRIAQENKHMFFLHSDSLEDIGLEISEGQPNKLYCSGEVTDKEYCHARKSENRYKVPKGTKFFRVKVRPASMFSKDASHNLYHSKSGSVDSTSVMSQSQTTVGSCSEIISETTSGSRSLPSSPPRSHPVIFEKDEVDMITSEQPEIFNPESVEHHFAEDSGIVENIEQAKVALDETILNDSVDRDTSKFEEQHAYISSTWLEMMISRVFNKSVHSTAENNL